MLVVGAGRDRIVPLRNVRRAAKRFRNGIYAEIADSDHMVFSAALTKTHGPFDSWLAGVARSRAQPLPRTQLDQDDHCSTLTAITGPVSETEWYCGYFARSSS